MDDLKQTPLYDLHLSLGARMVPFAGYALPVQYPTGVLKEHLHCRSRAALFDVSHMGQIRLSGPSWAAIADFAETLMPQDVLGLSDGRQRYGFFTNTAGGVEDDLMMARQGDDLLLVVNAARKAEDLALLETALPEACALEVLDDRALVALQGPSAVNVLSGLDPRADAMRFMQTGELSLAGHTVWASRSGYTGEDGFEISVPGDEAEHLAQRLLGDAAVAPAGLGARDSLRLEAGLCLYGQDIDASTGPISAGLGWAIPKVRRAGGARAGGFPGAEAVFAEIADGPARRRVGLRPEGRAPLRAGISLYAEEDSDEVMGHVTSGGYGPSVEAPVSMGYVTAESAGLGTRLWGALRGRRVAVEVASLPFVAPGYKR